MTLRTKPETHLSQSPSWKSSLWFRMPLIGTVLVIPLTGPASLFVAVYGTSTYGHFFTLFWGSFLISTSTVPLGAMLVGVPFELGVIRRRAMDTRQTALARCVAYAIWGALGGYLTYLAVTAWVLGTLPAPDTLLPALLVAFPLGGAVVGISYTLYEQFIDQMQTSARLTQELAVARAIQEDLFPRHFPQVKGLTFAGHCTPARETGGDFFDVINLGHGRVGVVVADVAGKSIAAALLMANARSIWRAAAATGAAPKSVLEQTNRALCEDIGSSTFVTLFYAIIDVTEPGVCFAGAGHPPPLLCHPRPSMRSEPPTGARMHSLRELHVNGLPLGLTPAAEYEEAWVSLLPGDRLILYTDGVVESLNAQRMMFGFERLNDTLAQLSADHPQAIIGEVLSTVQRFQGHVEQMDDMTIFAIQLDESVGL